MARIAGGIDPSPGAVHADFLEGGSTAAVTATESYTVRVGHGIPGWTSIVSMVDASVVVHVGGYSGHTTSVDRLKILYHCCPWEMQASSNEISRFFEFLLLDHKSSKGQ